MEIMRSENAAVKEMEAAAIAWVADLFGTPLTCVKARVQCGRLAWAGHMPAALLVQAPNHGAG
jgi:hypothetical protein